MENANQNSDVLEGKARNLKLGDLLKLSARSFRVRPARTFLTILGMAVGIGTVFFLISLGYGLQYILLGKLAPTADSLVSLEASYPEEGSLAITQSEINSIAALPGVKEISPVADNPGELYYSGLSGDVMVKIVDEKYDRLSGFVATYVLPNSKFDSGVVVSNTALRLLGLPEDATSLGKIVTASAIYPDNIVDKNGKSSGQKTVSTKTALPIIGIIKDASASPYVFVPSIQMQQAPSSFDIFFSRAADGPALEKLRADLIQKGFIISARVDTVKQAQRITNIITIVLAVFGVAALIVSSIGMFNTMLISFMERIFEVGIMKSIGATKRDILSMFLMESFLMGIMGGIGGLLLGWLGGTIVNFGMGILANMLGGKPVNLFIYPAPFIIFILGLSAVVGLMSGFWPARNAAKLSAREAYLRK